MKSNKKRNLLVGLIATGMISASVNAAVIFEDTFDRLITDADGNTVTTEDIKVNSTGDWFKINHYLRPLKTTSTAGDGLLTIHTEDKNSGVLSPVNPDFNFFNQELTYTFDGISIQTLGPSRAQSQWARFGVVAYSRYKFWEAKSFFTVSYNGSGEFRFQVQQRDGNSFDNSPRKDFRSRSFNFDVSKLRKVELTMDSVNYRVQFSFESDLDILSFGGPHNLDKSLWMPDTSAIDEAQQQIIYTEGRVTFNEGELAAAQVADPYVQADVDSAQDFLDEWVLNHAAAIVAYDEAVLAAQGLGGDAGLMMIVSSDAQKVLNSMSPTERSIFDADYANGTVEIGARATIDSVTVETTSILQGF